MNAAKRDLSGVFRPVEPATKNQRKSVLKKATRISANGVTFSSANYIAPFTEVQVRLQLLKRGPSPQSISCSGVVVDCQGNKSNSQYTVAVAFLDVPKTMQNELRNAQASSLRVSRPS
jgi:c-di-GMP-binding flagellar brake protein YcgR